MIILDTSIIVSYFCGNPNKQSFVFALVTYIIQNKVEIVVCEESLRELQRIIKSDRIKKLPHYNSKKVARFVAWYKYNTKKVSIDNTADINSTIRDANDIVWLQLASVVNASYLITLDNDLLILSSINSTKIVTPEQFMEEVG